MLKLGPARALLGGSPQPAEEEVIMYDEPTAGLDPIASTVVEDLIRSLHSGRSPVVTSYVVRGPGRGRRRL